MRRIDGMRTHAPLGRLGLAVLGGGALFAQAGDGGRTAFEEVGARRLPSVETRCGERDKRWILEVDGGGLLAGDFDGDGAHDLLVVDGSSLQNVVEHTPGRPPRLYLQDEGASLVPAGPAWALAGGRFGMGGAAGDVDGDGDLDALLTEWGPDRLVLNEANAGFREIGKESGLVGADWGTSAAFFDLERDGDLDLVVVNYLHFPLPQRNSSGLSSDPAVDTSCDWKGFRVLCGPEGLAPQADQLYRNGGDGTFEDVSSAAGFHLVRAAYGLGVTTLDFDLDGDTDLYVTNDSTPNHLWENLGDGGMREVGMRRGVAFDANGKEEAGMGIAVGDVDADGVEDLLCTNFSGESNSLYVTQGTGRYRERAASLGLGGHSVPYLGWGAHFLDVDLDGDLDLTVVNGHVYPQADEPGTDTSYAQPAFLYRNDGAPHFAPEPLSDGAPAVARASTWLDLANDGRLDLVVLTLDGPVRVLANADPCKGRHWLRVRLVDEASANVQALGARVRVLFGDATLVREVRTAGGFQAAVPAEAAFGLGDAKNVSIEVRWPDGEETRYDGVDVDRVLTLRRERMGERR